MKSPPPLYLASSSPRRQDILRGLRLEFTLASVAIDESPLDNEMATDMVVRLARAKAAAAAVAGNAVVLGADTAVVLDERILGKPRDRSDALEMLLGLSGRSHVVVTGVAVGSPAAPAAMQTAVSATVVRFREIGQDEAIRYWQSEEPRDKAGGYGIQGLGGAFVEAISGSYSGVVGLPVFETVQLLQAAGIEVLVDY